MLVESDPAFSVDKDHGAARNEAQQRYRAIGTGRLLSRIAQEKER